VTGLQGFSPEGDGRPAPTASPRGLSPVVDVLASLVRPASVVDVGSAHSGWSGEFGARGVDDVLVVRPPRHPALAGTDRPTLAHDLRRPLVLDRRFDLVVAVGTGERLPPGAAVVLARTLVDAAPAVAFASVMPGLAAPGTANARWPSWWDSVFAELGYVPHDIVRPLLWEDGEVELWIRQSVVVYAAPGRFPEVTLSAPGQRSVVHPEAYHRALGDAEARRSAESAVATERAFELDAACRRLEQEKALVERDLRELRERPSVDPPLRVENARLTRENALLGAAWAAAERDAANGPTPEQLVALTRRPMAWSAAQSVARRLPGRRRLRRIVGPAALLWDEAFYVSTTPTALDAPLGPLWHYRRHGAARLRAPHPWFDPEWYAAGNRDVVARGHDPVEHYLRVGWREGRDPHPLFATTWYGREHAAADGWRRSPLEHYLERGRRAALPPHPLFDTAWYLQANPDVVAEGADAVEHFCRRGWREGRSPHPLFDPGWYLEQNPDVARAGVNPLVHYLWFGWREGRDPHPLFDTASYVEVNADVGTSGLDPLSHYLTVGAESGLSTGRFDTGWYVEKHPDSVEHGRNPLVFFVGTGSARGDAPGPPGPDG
jgi:hypothetical protein